MQKTVLGEWTTPQANERSRQPGQYQGIYDYKSNLKKN
jgi:hypothetical protein